VRSQKKFDALAQRLSVGNPDIRQNWEILRESALLLGSSVEEFFNKFAVHSELSKSGDQIRDHDPHARATQGKGLPLMKEKARRPDDFPLDCALPAGYILRKC
jgi:hypothetical protein